MIEDEEGFYLSRDNDGHWHVIPIRYETEWSEFLELDPDDEASWDVPEWAYIIGGAPSLVTFFSYQVN